MLSNKLVDLMSNTSFMCPKCIVSIEYENVIHLSTLTMHHNIVNYAITKFNNKIQILILVYYLIVRKQLTTLAT